jgi:hypothetical protein
MEVNSELGNKIIKGDREAIDTVVDTFCDKAYSFSLYFFGDRGLAEEAVKKSFSAFFANARTLLEESSVPAAYFALLKGWCEKKHDEIKKENGEFFYNLELCGLGELIDFAHCLVAEIYLVHIKKSPELKYC